MEVVVVGAPGSGVRTIGQLLAERHGASFVDLAGPLANGVTDRVVGLSRSVDAGPEVRRVIAADLVLKDPRLRSSLYARRRVVWLDVPPDRITERLRAVPESGLPRGRSLSQSVIAHLDDYQPLYAAGTAIDGARPPGEVVGQIEDAIAVEERPGTLILRADTSLGLLELGQGTLGRSLLRLLERLGAERAPILTTEVAWRRTGSSVEGLLRDAGLPLDLVFLPDGAAGKTPAALEDAVRELVRRRIERRDVMVVLGDDVLLEAGGFAAAILLRGLRHIAVPTTTLGLIDTAIGGKSGVNVAGAGSNLLGAFHQPAGIVLDVDLVSSESPRERTSSLSEAVKYGVLGDERLLDLLEEARPTPDGQVVGGADLLELVERCALAKLRFVLPDVLDQEDRRLALNLGHTVSHALAAASGYAFTHGEVVAYGLRVALQIGVQLGVTPPSLAARGNRVLDRLGLAVDPVAASVDDVWTYLAADKKRRGGRIRWVIVSPTGFVIRRDVAEHVARAAIGEALAGRKVL
ncbi:MAG TPA: bifunctional shikimate kinase/3-dehydroquinate synthase [Candidatus Limnocylindrales bacterium]|nr:bifunctional shikimate kinase/3-dehydroquinate synthase [Candidatus Limnocylindrales bacterium]